MKPLFVPLSGVEESQKGSEGVGDRQRAEVFLQHQKNLEPLSVEGGASIFEKEADGTILEGGTELSLPVLACQQITSIGHQCQVIPCSGIARGAEPEQDKVAGV